MLLELFVHPALDGIHVLWLRRETDVIRALQGVGIEAGGRAVVEVERQIAVEKLALDHCPRPKALARFIFSMRAGARGAQA